MKVILVMNRFYNYYDRGDLFLKIFYEKAQLLFENPFLWNLKISPWKKLYVLLLWSTARTWHRLNYLIDAFLYLYNKCIEPNVNFICKEMLMCLFDKISLISFKYSSFINFIASFLSQKYTTDFITLV